MIYLALVPPWFWASTLLSLLIILFAIIKRSLFARSKLALAFYLLASLRSILAIATAFATSHYAIGKFPCLSGIFGVYSFPFLLALDAYLLFRFSRERHDHLSLQSPPIIRGPWLLVSWGITLNLLLLGAHFRSLALCTV